MKAFTIAAALDAGAIDTDTTVDDDNNLRLRNVRIQNARSKPPALIWSMSRSIPRPPAHRITMTIPGPPVWRLGTIGPPAARTGAWPGPRRRQRRSRSDSDTSSARSWNWPP